jgi:hypothetical protein
MTSKCKVSGALTALPGMSAQSICKSFQSDLARSLGEAGKSDQLLIALTLHKRGAIDVQISRNNGEKTVTYPVVTIDTIDRALQSDDIGRLAQAAAQMLTEDFSDGLASKVAPSTEG